MATSWLPKKQSPLEQWANKRVVSTGSGMDLSIWLLLGLTVLVLFSPPGQQLLQTVTNKPFSTPGTGDGFEDSLKQTLKWEGGSCSNVAGDHGGLTCKGITDAVYQGFLKRQGKPAQAVDKMTDDEMKAIYKGIWNQCKAGDKTMPLSFAVFDSCVTFDSSKIQDWFQNLPANPIEACEMVFDRRMAYRAEKAAEPGQAKFLAGWLNRDRDGKSFCRAYTVPGSVDTNRTITGGTEGAINQGQLPIKQMSLVSPVTTELVSSPLQAAVVIYAGSEMGSGAIISQDGLVLTAAHVVKCAPSCGINVTLSGGRRTTADLVKINAATDLALLKLHGGRYLALALAPKDAPPGTPVKGFGYGSPYRQENQGKVQTYNKSKLVFSGESFPGNSGGFLINGNNQLVGVIQAQLPPQNGIAMPTQAGSITEINQLLRQ